MDVRSLSRTEARVILSLEAESVELVTLDEIQKRARVSRPFARKLAHTLVRRGWLQRVRRGSYLLNPSRHGPDALPDMDPLRVGSRLVNPYYFGFATAAELLGLFPQASRTYYLVTTIRSTAGTTPDGRFRIVRVSRAHFFGTRSTVRRGVAVVTSDAERTILDCLTRPELSGGMAGVAQILSLAKPRLHWSRLSSYLDRLGNRSLGRRCGYLAEHVRPSIHPPRSWLQQWLPSPSDPFVPLGPARVYGRRGPRDARWRIIRNVTDSQLFAEGEIR